MKRVVIVGGGFAGSAAARELEGRFDVTLIDDKDYFEFTPSILRVIVEIKHIGKIQVRHKDYLKRAQVVRGKVSYVSPKAAFVDGKEYPYDYLILATGSTYKEIFKESGMILPIRAREMEQYYERLQNAGSVLLIGGGLVGVELAAEIVTKYPEKKVTIIHSKERLIERNPIKASKYAENFLKKRGVSIIFNERAKEKNGSAFVTDKGTTISADISFSSIGISPNGGVIKQHFPNSINESGQIKTNEYLQMPGYTKIFVIGDVTDRQEEKTAQNAEKEAKAACRNIILLEKGKSLRRYMSKPRPMIISLGKFNSLLVYKNFVMTGLIPAFLKWFVEFREMRHYI